MLPPYFCFELHPLYRQYYDAFTASPDEFTL